MDYSTIRLKAVSDALACLTSSHANSLGRELVEIGLRTIRQAGGDIQALTVLISPP